MQLRRRCRARCAALDLCRAGSRAFSSAPLRWTHLLAVLGFLNYLPFSKHLHVITAIPNVFFSSLEPPGRLAKLNLEDENAEEFGAADVRDLTWKQLLDG